MSLEDNARFSTDASTGLVSEMIATQVQCFYSPVDESARAMFNGYPFLNVNGHYVPLGGDMNVLEVDFTDKMLKCYSKLGRVGPTGNDLSVITVADILLIMKDAYDVEANERAAAIAAAIAAAEAAAAAAEAEE